MATMISMRPLLLVFALLLALASLPTARADIIIATAGPMAGTNAAFGEEVRRGAELAVDDINAAGGVNGERLVLLVEDDACDPRKAAEVAAKFIEAGAIFIAGHFCSGASMPAAKLYADAGVVLMSPASTNPKLTDEGGWNVFRTVARDDAQGDAAAGVIATHFAGKKVAIVRDKAAYGAALAARFSAALPAGTEIVLDETYASDSKEFGDLALRLTSAGPEVVYLAGAYPEAAQIVRAMREAGSEAQFIGADSLLREKFYAIAKESAAGTLASFAPDPMRLPAAQGLVRRFVAKGYQPEGATLYTYAAVQAFAAAAQATGGTDGRQIASWLRQGHAIATAVGEISFDAKGDVARPRYTWYRWREGRFSEADDINNPQ